MEFKKLVFPAPSRQWEWDDFIGQVFWVPVPKNAMTQLSGIFSGLNDISMPNSSVMRSSCGSSRIIGNEGRSR